MKTRVLVAIFAALVLAYRNAVDPTAPWFSQIALAASMTLFWGAGFWMFKTYGIAAEEMGADRSLRAILEYGLPPAVLCIIVWRGEKQILDVVLALVVWISVGTSWRQYRSRLSRAAIGHATRFLSECGFPRSDSGMTWTVWPLHLAVIVYAIIMALVGGFR